MFKWFQETTKPSRSTRTKLRNPEPETVEPEPVDQNPDKPNRSTRTKQRNLEPETVETESFDIELANPVRSTRTKQRNLEKTAEPAEQRSTRTKQRVLEAESSSSVTNDEPLRRNTRTKQRLLESGSEGSDKEGLTRALASPRVKELALRALSPGGKNMPSPRQHAFAG